MSGISAGMCKNDRKKKYHNPLIEKWALYLTCLSLIVVIAKPGNAVGYDYTVDGFSYMPGAGVYYTPSNSGICQSDGWVGFYYFYTGPSAPDQALYPINGKLGDVVASIACTSSYHVQSVHMDIDEQQSGLCDPPSITYDSQGYIYDKIDGFATTFTEGAWFYCTTWTVQYAIYKKRPNQCINGQTRPCYSGKPESTKLFGMCHEGAQVCINREWDPTCHDEVVPQAEKCDGHDYNCNGKNDDGCDPCKIDPICCGNALCLDCLKQQK